MAASQGVAMAQHSLALLANDPCKTKIDCRLRMEQVTNWLNQIANDGSAEAQSLRIDLQTYQSFLIRLLDGNDLPETAESAPKVVVDTSTALQKAAQAIANANESAARATDLVSKQQAATQAANALILAQQAQAAAAALLASNNSTANQNAVDQAAAALHTATGQVAATSQAVNEAKQKAAYDKDNPPPAVEEKKGGGFIIVGLVLVLYLIFKKK